MSPDCLFLGEHFGHSCCDRCCVAVGRSVCFLMVYDASFVIFGVIGIQKVHGSTTIASMRTRMAVGNVSGCVANWFGAFLSCSCAPVAGAPLTSCVSTSTYNCG